MSLDIGSRKEAVMSQNQNDPLGRVELTADDFLQDKQGGIR